MSFSLKNEKYYLKNYKKMITYCRLKYYSWKRKFYKGKESIKFHTKSSKWKKSNKIPNSVPYITDCQHDFEKGKLENSFK